MKLKEKRQAGHKVTRIYERPATLYQRVLTDQQIDALSRQLWASVQTGRHVNEQDRVLS